MEHRNADAGNANARGVRGMGAACVCHLTFSVSGLLFFIFLSCAAYAAPPTATPAPHAPEGFGTAKFGMTLEQVRQLYPTLAKAPVVTSAAYFRLPSLTRYWITKVDVPGLRSQCDVEFRFWKNRLWSVVVYYGANAFADVAEKLRREYGPPSTKSRDPSWAFGSASITTSPGQMWYSLDDNEIGKDVQRGFTETIQQQRARRAAHPPAGTPPMRPTPAGQTPAGHGSPTPPAP
jgi:hypothetical protein